MEDSNFENLFRASIETDRNFEFREASWKDLSNRLDHPTPKPAKFGSSLLGAISAGLIGVVMVVAYLLNAAPTTNTAESKGIIDTVAPSSTQSQLVVEQTSKGTTTEMVTSKEVGKSVSREEEVDQNKDKNLFNIIPSELAREKSSILLESSPELRSKAPETEINVEAREHIENPPLSQSSDQSLNQPAGMLIAEEPVTEAESVIASMNIDRPANRSTEIPIEEKATLEKDDRTEGAMGNIQASDTPETTPKTPLRNSQSKAVSKLSQPSSYVSGIEEDGGMGAGHKYGVRLSEKDGAGVFADGWDLELFSGFNYEDDASVIFPLDDMAGSQFTPFFTSINDMGDSTSYFYVGGVVGVTEQQSIAPFLRLNIGKRLGRYWRISGGLQYTRETAEIKEPALEDFMDVVAVGQFFGISQGNTENFDITLGVHFQPEFGKWKPFVGVTNSFRLFQFQSSTRILYVRTTENSFTEVDRLNERNFVGRSSDLPQVDFTPIAVDFGVKYELTSRIDLGVAVLSTPFEGNSLRFRRYGLTLNYRL